MNSYRELEIYQLSKKLAIGVHKMSLALPKIEMYEEGSQIRRCSKSVTAMIVEGFARRKYKADYIKYLIYSLGECDETIVHLDFLFETGSMPDQAQYKSFRDDYDILSMKINKFIQWVDRNL